MNIKKILIIGGAVALSFGGFIAGKASAKFTLGNFIDRVSIKSP